MILTTAVVTMRRELAAGHGHERAVDALDNLEVADYEAVVKGNGTKRLKPLSWIFHEFDSHLGDVHGCPP
jgi:hypothetical protein